MEAHERSNEVFLKLAEQGVITIYDSVDNEMVANVRDRLAVAQANRARELEIRIQTPGGNTLAGLHIYDMIRAASVEKRRGLVPAYSSSMGSIILQACDVREAMRHARILIHYVAVEEKIPLLALRDPQMLRNLLRAGEICQKAIETILVKRTGRKLSEIRKICARDADMSSEEALDFGLIDSIRD